MNRAVIRRPEMRDATLTLGGTPISLADYETTGLVGVSVAPRGHGKTNAALLVAEQLSTQGWVSVLVDPEEELEGLYGHAMSDPEELRHHLIARDLPIVVVNVRDADSFVPYGKVILEVGDSLRKPIFVMVDEGQIFSSSRGRKDDGDDASSIIRAIVERGRKRAIDIMITALRYSRSLDRSIFANKNLTLVGCQEDPVAWSSLAQQFKASGIKFDDVHGLEPGEFICFSRGSTQKIRMPMAKALQAAAPKARIAPPRLPNTFTQWVKAMKRIPTARLQSLDLEVVSVLSNVAGLAPKDVASGMAALRDEIALRGVGGG